MRIEISEIIPNVTKEDVSAGSAFWRPCVFKASEARLRKGSIEDLAGKRSREANWRNKTESPPQKQLFFKQEKE